MTSTVDRDLDAVIFDWGGTLTRWHDIDFHAESLALAAAVTTAGHDRASGPTRPSLPGSRGARQGAARGRGRRLGALARPPAERHDRRPLLRGRARARPGAADGVPRVLGAAHRAPIPRSGRSSSGCGPTGCGSACCRTRSGRASGTSRSSSATASTTSWTATSTPARSPGRSPRRTPSAAAMDAVGVTDPARCVYVGDRLFDDVWGAQQAGMRAVHIPLSAIPPTQVGHTEGTPDGVVQSLSELPACAGSAVNFMFWHCTNMRHSCVPRVRLARCMIVHAGVDHPP